MSTIDRIEELDRYANALKAEQEAMEYLRARRERAIAWVRQPEHHVKRRVLRQHFESTLSELKADGRAEPSGRISQIIGGVADAAVFRTGVPDLGRTLAEYDLTAAGDRNEDAELLGLLGAMPNVTAIVQRPGRPTTHDHHLAIPNGNGTFDVLSVHRSFVPHSHETISRYALESCVIRVPALSPTVQA